MTEIIVEFDRSAQGIGALCEAAYRIIGDASCQIETRGERHLCRLTPKERPRSGAMGRVALREHFLDLVTDENLREKIAAETSGVRDVILALAFGALAGKQEGATSLSIP
jgi:His-Xaa-Ser system protein HxsD